MASKRFPMATDIFAGSEKLRDLNEIVGMVTTGFGGIEETLRYLDWQLWAFALAAAMPPGTPDTDVQLALAVPRAAYFAKHRLLSQVLAGINKSLSEPSVTAALGSETTTVVSEWRALKACAQDLGNRRNSLAHAAIGISGTSLVRSKGLMMPATPVDPRDDMKLVRDIGALRLALGPFINRLTDRLPFRDHDQAAFADPAEI